MIQIPGLSYTPRFGCSPQISRLSISGHPVSTTNVTTHTHTAPRSLLEDDCLITDTANITTLPLVAYYFGRLSLVSLLNNLLIALAALNLMLTGVC